MLSFPVLPHWAKFCRPCGAYACGVSGPWPRLAAPQSAAAEASPLPGVDTLRRAVGESAQVLAARALGLAARALGLAGRASGAGRTGPGCWPDGLWRTESQEENGGG